MKKSLIIIGALLLSIGIFAQGREDRKVDSFDKINVSSAIRLVLNIGDKESVTVETEENLLKQVKTEVKSGELNLYIDGHFNSEKGVVIRVTAKSIKEIEAGGATYVDVKDVIKGDKLKLTINGASKMKTQIKVDELSLELSGASHVTLSGEAEKMKAEVSGAAGLKADNLKVKDADIETAGAASASIDVSENLKAEASGAGHIRYSGNPRNKSCDARSAGYIQCQQALAASENSDSTDVKMYDSNRNSYMVRKPAGGKKSDKKKSR
jgi:hypothetical protein